MLATAATYSPTGIATATITKPATARARPDANADKRNSSATSTVATTAMKAQGPRRNTLAAAHNPAKPATANTPTRQAWKIERAMGGFDKVQESESGAS